MVPVTFPAQVRDILSFCGLLLLLFAALRLCLLLQLGDQLCFHHFLFLEEVIPFFV